jgi:hypothetical protein
MAGEGERGEEEGREAHRQHAHAATMPDAGQNRYCEA